MAGSIDNDGNNHSTPPTLQNSNGTTVTNNSCLIDHKFEGWSVWLEIDAEDHPALAQECEILYRKYQHRQGVDPFVPHVTILYNFPPFDDSDGSETTQQRAERLLQQAKTSFREQHKKQFLKTTKQQEEEDTQHQASMKPQDAKYTTVCPSVSSLSRPLLTPTDFYFFHYPKSADNGKGFGCVISMLLIEKEQWLSSLHSVVQASFPRDERGSANGSFTPHLSLVYAPEDDLESLQAETVKRKEKEDHALLKPIPARYLSLWSTEGAIKDWYRIARIEL